MTEGRLLTIESWERGRKTLHWEQLIEPLSDLDRTIVADALERSGFGELVASIAAKGYAPEEARRRAAVLIATECAQEMHDEEAYLRVCERRGLLPL